MAVSVLVWVLAAAVLVSVVLLAFVCLRCRDKGPQAFIRQGDASEDYMPSNQFRVVHTSHPSNDLNSVHLSSNLLSPFSSLSEPGAQRRHLSFTPTETESNPSYENPADGPEYMNDESDAEDPGYIIVLPEGEMDRSTPNSDGLPDYENVPKKEDAEYLNVELRVETGSTPDQSSSDDEDDDEGNYVNIPDRTLTNDRPQ